MAKLSINLLQVDLLPSKPFWTLNRVVIIWAISLLAMLAIMFLTQYSLKTTIKEHTNVHAMNTQQKDQLSRLEVAISNNRKDQNLLNKLDTLKLVIANKEQLHLQLTDPKQTYSAGFSTVMSELAQLHNNNISLQHVRIANDDMSFSGLARSPDAVPYWLSKFEDSTFLSGKKFVNFTLAENDQNITEFTVSSASNSSHISNTKE